MLFLIAGIKLISHRIRASELCQSRPALLIVKIKSICKNRLKWAAEARKIYKIIGKSGHKKYLSIIFIQKVPEAFYKDLIKNKQNIIGQSPNQNIDPFHQNQSSNCYEVVKLKVNAALVINTCGKLIGLILHSW